MKYILSHNLWKLSEWIDIIVLSTTTWVLSPQLGILRCTARDDSKTEKSSMSVVIQLIEKMSGRARYFSGLHGVKCRLLTLVIRVSGDILSEVVITRECPQRYKMYLLEFMTNGQCYTIPWSFLCSCDIFQLFRFSISSWVIPPRDPLLNIGTTKHQPVGDDQRPWKATQQIMLSHSFFILSFYSPSLTHHHTSFILSITTESIME